MSTASDIASAIAARLAEITTANGYATDIGQTVFRGKLQAFEDDVPCAILVEGDDKLADDASTANMNSRAKSYDVKLRQRYYVVGNTRCDPDNPNDAAHLIIADLKKAIFSGDRTFGGAVRRLHYVGRVIGRREDGLALVGASVVFDAEFAEDVANP